MKLVINFIANLSISLLPKWIFDKLSLNRINNNFFYLTTNFICRYFIYFLKLFDPINKKGNKRNAWTLETCEAIKCQNNFFD